MSRLQCPPLLQLIRCSWDLVRNAHYIDPIINSRRAEYFHLESALAATIQLPTVIVKKAIPFLEEPYSFFLEIEILVWIHRLPF